MPFIFRAASKSELHTSMNCRFENYRQCRTLKFSMWHASDRVLHIFVFSPLFSVIARRPQLIPVKSKKLLNYVFNKNMKFDLDIPHNAACRLNLLFVLLFLDRNSITVYYFRVLCLSPFDFWFSLPLTYSNLVTSHSAICPKCFHVSSGPSPRAGLDCYRTNVRL